MEDFPSLAIHRDRLFHQGLDWLVAETIQHGGSEWQGDSKTAKSIRADGWRQGLQGIFARLLWFALLHPSGSDPVFPTHFPIDEAIVREFLEGGRSRDQTMTILESVQKKMESFSLEMSSLEKKEDFLSLLSSPSHRGWKLIQFQDKQVTISSTHFLKLLHLYQRYTNPAVLETDPIFVRFVCLFVDSSPLTFLFQVASSVLCLAEIRNLVKFRGRIPNGVSRYRFLFPSFETRGDDGMFCFALELLESSFL
jgi:hypothetical protein